MTSPPNMASAPPVPDVAASTPSRAAMACAPLATLSLVTWIVWIWAMGNGRRSASWTPLVGWIHAVAVLTTLGTGLVGLVATGPARHRSGRRHAVLALLTLAVLIGAWVSVFVAGMNGSGPLSD